MLQGRLCDVITELFPTSQSSDLPCSLFTLSRSFLSRSSIFDSHFHSFESAPPPPPPLRHFGIEIKKPSRPLSFVSVFFRSAVKMEPLFLSVHLVISSSFPLCALPSFFINVNKAASRAWKRWQHSRAYRRPLCFCSV